MKEKRITFINIYSVLKELENEKAPVRFSFAVVKNLKELQNEIEPLQKITMQSIEENEKYESERKDIIEKFCEKDEKGKPKIENNQYKIPPGSMNGFNYEMEQLNVKYPEVKENLDKREKEIQELIQEEIEVKLNKIHLKDLPESLTPKQVEILMPIIEE
jgi:hypothetical protein